jgi:lipoprotein-releasing system permease protein
MNFKYFIASRYLFSKKDSKFVSFITYISIVGVALGVAALIIAVSIMNGFEEEIKSKVSGLVSHVQISSFLNNGIADHEYGMKQIKENIEGVTGVSRYVQKEAVIRAKDKIEGIIFKGIDPNEDISNTREKVVEGEFNLSPVDSNVSRLIIGSKLAKSLNIGVGDKVIVFGLRGIPSPLNQPKIKQFVISGLYQTTLRDYDDIIIYSDMGSTQELFDLGNNVSGIELKLDDIDRADTVVSQLADLLGYPYYPKSLFRIYRALFSFVELQQKPVPIILSLIVLVATFNIVSTLLMLVLEKTHSVGVLKSLGASRGDIMKIFIYDGLLIGIIGTIIGIILGVGACMLEMKFHLISLPDFYYVDKVPILLETHYIILISLITLALCFFATLIPAFLASRLDPVKSLRFA